MPAIKWSVPTSVATVLTAANLQSLANGAEVTGAEYDNSTALDLMADFQLAIQWDTSVSGISEGTKILELYLLASIDGTQYPSVGASGLPQKSLLIGAIGALAPSISALDYPELIGVPLPPGKFKILASNVSGQTFDPSATMFLKMRPYQLQSV